eukprot:12937837-Prorocentrum_lima.AAC.1
MLDKSSLKEMVLSLAGNYPQQASKGDLVLTILGAAVLYPQLQRQAAWLRGAKGSEWLRNWT